MTKTKIVILCGGHGTRIRDISEILPKPMLPVGERPILWHIMKIYGFYGFTEFVLCLGYKGWLIKEFFLNYYAKNSDLTVSLGQEDSIIYHQKTQEADWRVTLVDTGEESQTGRRIWLAKPYLDECDTFGVTYGDGVADINIQKLFQAHNRFKKLLTITGVQPLGRFGEIELKGNTVCEFNEKPNTSKGLINGGFMVFNHSVLKRYFAGDKNTSLEADIIPRMVKDKQVAVYKHQGAWQCVDTPREYNQLNALWSQGKAFWKRW